jgi:DNA invertase Pin-like site-specific DNA recombinase
MNTDLTKKLQAVPPTYEDCADDMVTMLNMWFSRQGIAQKYKVSYSTVCYWIRKKQKELKDEKVHNVVQSQLI